MTSEEELIKLLMESYDRGLKDAKQAAMETFPIAIYEAVRIEREACAKVCEQMNHYMDDGDAYAAAIRARGARHDM
jgi:hypothetical protein